MPPRPHITAVVIMTTKICQHEIRETSKIVSIRPQDVNTPTIDEGIVKLKGPLLLLTTAFLWGTGFVAQTFASHDVEPFTFNAARSFAGALFLIPVVAWRKRTGQDTTPATGSARNYSQRTLWIAGCICGFVLFIASYLQQWGITSYPPDAGASSRAGFVTTTYIVIIACAVVLQGRRPHPLVFLAVALTLCGMYLLCVPDGLGSVYLGDWLVLGCAFVYSAHILLIDHYTYLDGVRLSLVQLFVAGALSVPAAFIFENPSTENIMAALIPILYTGICSNGIAYTLQIIGQQSTPPTVASIIMTLEAVFAALGGWLILHEQLSPIELSGCALVFAAVLLAQIPALRKTPSNK